LKPNSPKSFDHSAILDPNKLLHDLNATLSLLIDKHMPYITLTKK